MALQDDLLMIVRMGLACLLCALCLHALLFFEGELAQPAADAPRRFEAGVVFTGDHDRIDAALDMLESGRIRTLFVSGANPNAGIWLDRFAAQFGPQHPRLAEQLRCCVTFGPRADTTLQNALESACWLNEAGIAGPVALVTSWEHMARARAALTRFSDHAIVPAPVGEAGARADEPRRLALEYLKTWGTMATLLAPRRLAPGAYGDFRDGCPAEVAVRAP